MRILAAAGVVVALGLIASLALFHKTGTSESATIPTAGLIHIVPSIDHPSEPAQLTRAAAVDVARRKWGPALTHPYSVAYGSHDFSEVGRRTATGLQSLDRRDVWLITVSGVQVGTNCAPKRAAERACPPSYTTLAINVDDKAGKVIMAEG